MDIMEIEGIQWCALSPQRCLTPHPALWSVLCAYMGTPMHLCYIPYPVWCTQRCWGAKPVCGHAHAV